MKAIIITFSGTGNTYITNTCIAETLNQKDVKTDHFRLEKIDDILDTIHFEEYNLIIIGYPIHAFNAPQNVVELAKKLPKATGQRVYITKTSGEPFWFNDASSYLLYKHLSKKGYNVISEKHFLMPYNIMFRYKDALVKQMYRVMQKMAVNFTEKMLTENTSTIHYSLAGRGISFLFRIQWLGARLNGLLYSANQKKCTFCKICAKNCPANNIEVHNSKVQFHSHCMMCMRCVQNCPTEAISIGILRFWAVKGKYDFKRILSDTSIKGNYINKNTKGYFKLFRKYYSKFYEY
ncbi:MAG: EFR1 family ferrodoxin [Clostridiales bacterium]|nr:EFR1 family ferrodoxin [Clostridiales bacterium]